MSNKATVVFGVLGDGLHQGEWCGYKIVVGATELKTDVGVRGRYAVVVTARGGEVAFVRGTLPSTTGYALTGLTLDQAVFVRRLIESAARDARERWGNIAPPADAAQELADMAATQLPSSR